MGEQATEELAGGTEIDLHIALGGLSDVAGPVGVYKAQVTLQGHRLCSHVGHTAGNVL